MEDKLISAKALLDKLPIVEDWDKQVSLVGAISDFIILICNAPAIEAKPVVHAHWEYLGVSDGKKIYKCTNCKAHIHGTGNFCKECGAIMDEKEGE